MVLFGELVIPSSRILWDDEDDFDQVQGDSPTLEWHGDTIVPNDISNLLIVESSKLTQIAQTCLTENNEPVCSLREANVSIYKTVEDNYIVLCKDAKNIIPGEVTEKLIPWLEKAKRILAVTSAVAAMYQKITSEELPPCFIKALSRGSCGAIHASKLESPNLVTGIAAGVLSYCQHIGKSATLYVCYLDSRPLDSTTAGSILQLFRKLDFSTTKGFIFKPTFTADSNLYM